MYQRGFIFSGIRMVLTIVLVTGGMTYLVQTPQGKKIMESAMFKTAQDISSSMQASISSAFQVKKVERTLTTLAESVTVRDPEQTIEASHKIRTQIEELTHAIITEEVLGKDAEPLKEKLHTIGEQAIEEIISARDTTEDIQQKKILDLEQRLIHTLTSPEQTEAVCAL